MVEKYFRAWTPGALGGGAPCGHIFICPIKRICKSCGIKLFPHQRIRTQGGSRGFGKFYPSIVRKIIPSPVIQLCALFFGYFFPQPIRCSTDLIFAEMFWVKSTKHSHLAEFTSASGKVCFINSHLRLSPAGNSLFIECRVSFLFIVLVAFCFCFDCGGICLIPIFCVWHNSADTKETLVRLFGSHSFIVLFNEVAKIFKFATPNFSRLGSGHEI